MHVHKYHDIYQETHFIIYAHPLELLPLLQSVNY